MDQIGAAARQETVKTVEENAKASEARGKRRRSRRAGPCIAGYLDTPRMLPVTQILRRATAPRPIRGEGRRAFSLCSASFAVRPCRRWEKEQQVNNAQHKEGIEHDQRSNVVMTP